MPDLVKRQDYFRTKFDSARDEWLYSMSDNMWANESSGDSESPAGWFARNSISPDELPEIVQAFPDELNTMIHARECVSDLVGHWLISGDSVGFVYVQGFESESELIEAYNALDRAYDEWSEQDA